MTFMDQIIEFQGLFHTFWLTRLHSIAILIFVVILVEFDKYWDEQACLDQTHSDAFPTPGLGPVQTNKSQKKDRDSL